MKTVEERIKYLETRLRRYQGLTMLIGLVVVALVTISAKPTIPDVIRARKFEVVNPQGVTVIFLESWELGGWLAIRNNDRKFTTLITQSDAGNGYLEINSKEGNDRISLGSEKDDVGGYVAVTNKTGERVVTLSVDEYGNGVVGAWDRKGEGVMLKPGP